jgi:two-component sensor histidine kinase
MSEHRLKHQPEAAGQARSLVTDEIGGSLPPADADAFVLLTTELVTNAVRHAPPDADGNFTLKLEVTDTTARAIVIDAGTEFEFERATFDANTDNHFGLQLVDQLASRWGLSLDGEKAVWFELDR